MSYIMIMILLMITNLLVSSCTPLVSQTESPDVNRKSFPSRRNRNLYKASVELPIKSSPVTYDEDDTADNAVETHMTKFVAECLMPTTFGPFRMRSYIYSSRSNKLEPAVLIAGDLGDKENVLVRVHDQCFTGEVFGSRRCDCREQLHESLRLVQQDGGIIIYLQQEGRGIGLSNKIAAYSLQDDGMDTVDANVHLGFDEEMREYKSVPDILKNLGIKSIRLITNNPFKMSELRSLGVTINERIAIKIPPNPFNIRYLKSKRDRMQHIFPEDLVDEKETESESISWQKKSIPVDEDANNSIIKDDVSAVNLWIGDLDLAVTADTYEGKAHYAFGRASVEAAINAIKDGKMVLVVDDEGRENEGDLIMSAEHATPETIGFIVRYSSGVICVSMEGSRLNALKLPPMVVNNQDPKQTAYSITVDAVHNTTTGISSSDRAITLRALADPHSKISDFQRPGHVFPLRYRTGGVLTRGGHTEASLDLVKLSGLQSRAAVLAEVVNDDGSVMRLEALKAFAEKNKLVLTSVQDLIAYRVETERT